MNTENQAPDPAHKRVKRWAEQHGVRFVSRSHGQQSTDTISLAALEALAGDVPAPEGADAGQRLTDVLPPLPGHPEPRTRTWTALEARAIERYGADCARAALAAPAPQATDAELERHTGEPHVDGWPLVSGLPAPQAAPAMTHGQARQLLQEMVDAEQSAAPQAAPVALTDAQVDRLYANVPPSAQQDARSREAFRRLVRVIEDAHGIKEQP